MAVALRNTSSHLPADVMERFWSRASTPPRRRRAGPRTRGHLARRGLHLCAVPGRRGAGADDHLPDYAPRSTPARLTTATAWSSLEQEHFRCDHALPAGCWRAAGAVRPDRQRHPLPPRPRSLHPAREGLPSDALALIAVSVIAEHVLGDYTHDAHAVGDRSFENAKTFLGPPMPDGRTGTTPSPLR